MAFPRPSGTTRAGGRSQLLRGAAAEAALGGAVRVIAGLPEARSSRASVSTARGRGVVLLRLRQLVVHHADLHRGVLGLLKLLLSEGGITAATVALSEANHLYDTGDFDYERAGAWLAGHDAAKLIRRHSPDPGRIEEKVRSILTPEIDPDGLLCMIGEVIDMDMSAEQALSCPPLFFPDSMVNNAREYLDYHPKTLKLLQRPAR